MIDSLLTIELPGERTRATVRKVVNPATVIVELTSIPMIKDHNYQQGNFVECNLHNGMFGSVWKGAHKMTPVFEEPIKEVKNVRIRRAKSDK